MSDCETGPDDVWAEKVRAAVALLAELGVTPAEAALFQVIHYGITVPPDDLVRRATIREYNVGDPVNLVESQAALAACLAKGWLRVVDEGVLRQIKDEVRQRGLLGPVYGYPYLGGVDFAPEGARLWQLFRHRRHGIDRDFNCPFTDVVRERYSSYFVTESAAVRAIERLKEYADVVSIDGPVRVGAWRANWWRRFPFGYRVDCEERRQWTGRSQAQGGYLWYTFPEDRFRLTHAQDALDRCNVTLAEWIAMTGLEHPNRVREVLFDSAKSAEAWGVSIPRPSLADGMLDCVRKGWVRKLSPRSFAELQAMLAAEGTLMPVPLDHELGPSSFDFTPEGAQVYRMASAAIFGDDWEDAISVTQGRFSEVHYYAVNERSLDALLSLHHSEKVTPNEFRVTPIGPWCLYWWRAFETGYRHELTFGEAQKILPQPQLKVA